MSSNRLVHITEWVKKFLWYGFLVSLPITSFPFFPAGVGGATLVRPLSIYPLAGLLILVIIPVLFRKPLPKILLPLLLFVILAVVSSLVSIARGVEPNFGFTVSERVLRNLVTLGLGVLFYLAVVLIPDSRQELTNSIMALYAGFGVALTWASLQVIYVLMDIPGYFQWMRSIQRYISIRRLFRNRISGMTYEPNWFAEQITFLLMPWLFAAVFSGHSVFKWRWRKVTIELVLLLWASFVLIFTFSRTGIILLLFQLVVGFLAFVRIGFVKGGWQQFLVKAGMALIIAAVLIGIVYLAGQQNNYFARIWTFFTEDAGGELSFFQFIAFNQRFIYWQTAYQIFQSHPLIGVGLGNFTFYFDKFIPDVELYKIPEILRKLTPAEGVDQIVTVKSLHVRILAETGLASAAAFAAFLLVLVGCVLWLYSRERTEVRFWGMAGILSLLVFLLAGFSFDSFALPNMWVVFGLISAAYHIYRRNPDYFRTTKNTRPSLSGDSNGSESA